MTKNEKKKRLSMIVERLKEIYPNAECALHYDGDPWKLLIMGRLSAQCTDKKVNQVCEILFAEFPDMESMADADPERVMEIIKPCGLYRKKAENLIDSSRMLITDFGGKLPDTMDELLKFPGVGRKIANLLLGDIFGKEAIVCDTHCIRICGRLGMYPESITDATKVEKILRELIDMKEGSDFCHRIVLFGRETCDAKKPLCDRCPLSDLCLKYEKTYGKN
jgi:endonuclease-3